MKKFFLFITAMLLTLTAQAAIHTETVIYKEGDAVLEGYLAYDEAIQEKRPGVLIVHEWTGLGDYVKGRANQLAEMGYIAFAADIYGQGIRPQTPEEAGKEATLYKSDRPLLRRRVLAGLEQLKAQNFIDEDRIAAIGYCFGGTTVLELARSGADVKGIVSFHGALNTPTPEDAKNIKAQILVLHGADDPFVPMTEVEDFKKEMRDAKVKAWEIIMYPGAVHSFTNPAAGNDNSKGAAYNEAADKKSWEDMKNFFAKVLK